ncbi:MAG: SpoIID/LytB domain-containing protein [Firmicutes bacterium]|nr:SpoIID/LytB domain-containing protein [Bacillota bacterium]
MNKKHRYLLALLLLASVFLSAGCPGKEETLFKNLVTRFGKPPEITVFIKETGKVKKMDIEEYLLGVVAGEMKPGWPLNAYAAQAIIARTFTMEFLARGGTRKLHKTDISTDEKEAQAYNAANITPTIRNAVRMTKGLVLTYKERYIKGWYSASCGGRTTKAREGLAYKGPEPPYIQSVKCPEEKRIPKDELYWQATLSSSEINAALQKMNQPGLGAIQKIEVLKRSKSQRATQLKLAGAKGSAKVSGADFRISLGPEKLRSIWISNEINNQPDKITVKGRGFGHGVGLCQWGAYTLAKDNKSPQDIVKHYYPKAHVSKIW